MKNQKNNAKQSDSKKLYKTQYDLIKSGSAQNNKNKTLLEDYEDLDIDDNFEEDEALKNQILYEHTEGQQKIWRLFKSLDCPQCMQMYNNKERKPFIICANNHLLCKSCYAKTRQTSFLCPYSHCRIRMSTRLTATNQSIQLFLRIYNQIFNKQKSMIQEKRKRSHKTFHEIETQFQIPKNIKTLVFLLLIIVTPWMFDALKFIVGGFVAIEEMAVNFAYQEVNDLLYITKVILQDTFYISLFTDENGEYKYYGDDIFEQLIQGGNHTKGVGVEGSYVNGNSHINFQSLYTARHIAKIQMYMKVVWFASLVVNKFVRVVTILISVARVLNYSLHFIILVIGIVQFPFLLPIILVRLQFIIPPQYKYRIGLYLDIIQLQQPSASQQHQNSTSSYYDQSYLYDQYHQQGHLHYEEICKRLSKGEMYILLMARGYIRSVMKIYKNIEKDMKRRCDDLEYKKRMRVVAGCKGKGESGAGKGDKEATRDKNIGKDKDNEKDAGISNKGTKNGHKTNNNSTSSKFKFTF